MRVRIKKIRNIWNKRNPSHAGRFAWGRGWLLLWSFLLLFAAGISLTCGRYGIELQQLVKALLPALFPEAEVEATVRTVLYQIRLPRICLAMLSGAGLAVSGAAFQGLFGNPLATPDTLGAANGAAFGAVLGILFGFSALGIQLCALGMGMAAVAMALLLGKRRGESSTMMIILAGMVIGALFSALISYVKYTADPQDVLPQITYWLMGSLATTTKGTLQVGAPLILVGTLLIYLLRWKLNLMSLPAEEARALGVPVAWLRLLLILAASMVTASVVSMCGQIGWVGLLIPHMVRMLYGNENRAVIPASALLGAIFLLVIDTVARSAAAAEIPVAILTALLGAPCFILLLKKTGGISS